MRAKRRRNHPRYQNELPVTMVTQEQALDAVSVDLSLGGMRLRSPQPLQPEERIRLRFRLPTLDVDTEVDAIVRWRDGDLVGVHFESLRARDVWALNRLLREHAG